MLSHRRYERACEIDAHLPVHTRGTVGGGQIGKRIVCCYCEFACPNIEFWIACRPAYLIERMHPLGQIMKILAIPFPFQALIKGLGFATFRKLLADAQSTAGRMGFAILCAQSADPATAWIVIPITSEDVVDLINQVQSKFFVALLTGRTCQAKVITHRKSIRPQIASWWAIRIKSGTLGEAQHEYACICSTRIRHIHQLLIRTRD